MKIRQVSEDLFRDAGIHKPNLILECESIDTLFELAVRGVASSLINQSFIPRTHQRNLCYLKDPCRFAFFASTTRRQEVRSCCPIYLKGHYRSKAARRNYCHWKGGFLCLINPPARKQGPRINAARSMPDRARPLRKDDRAGREGFRYTSRMKPMAEIPSTAVQFEGSVLKKSGLAELQKCMCLIPYNDSIVPYRSMVPGVGTLCWLSRLLLNRRNGFRARVFHKLLCARRREN